MIIRLERSGGFAAFTLHCEVNLDQLAAQERQHLAQLIESASFFDLPDELPASPGADRFQYTLTIEYGETSHTIQAGESALPEPLQELVDEVTQLARRKRG